MIKLIRIIIAIYILINSNITVAQITFDINPELTKNVWKANRIRHSNTKEHYGDYYFRKQFQLVTIPSKFIIHISADNRYWLFINGQGISTVPAKGDLEHCRFESLDVARYLNKGENVMAVTVWNQGYYRAASQETYQTGLFLTS